MPEGPLSPSGALRFCSDGHAERSSSPATWGAHVLALPRGRLLHDNQRPTRKSSQYGSQQSGISSSVAHTFKRRDGTVYHFKLCCIYADSPMPQWDITACGGSAGDDRYYLRNVGSGSQPGANSTPSKGDIMYSLNMQNRIAWVVEGWADDKYR